MNLETWLKQENILSCLDGLKAAGVTEPNELCELTEQDLEAMLGWNLLTRRRVIKAISKLNGMNQEPTILEVAQSRSRHGSGDLIKPGVRSKTKSPRMKPNSPHYRRKKSFSNQKPREKGHKGRSRSVNCLSSLSITGDDWGRYSDKSVTSIRTTRPRTGSRTREKRRKVTKFLPNGRTVTEWSTPRRNSGGEEKPHSDPFKSATKLPDTNAVLVSVVSAPMATPPAKIAKKYKTMRYLDRPKSHPPKPKWVKSSSLRSQKTEPKEMLRYQTERRSSGKLSRRNTPNDYFSDISSGEHQNMQGFWRDWSDDTGSPAYNDLGLPNFPVDSQYNVLDSPSMPPMDIIPQGQQRSTVDLGAYHVSLSSDEFESNANHCLRDTQQNISYIPEGIPLTPGEGGGQNEFSGRKKSKSRRSTRRRRNGRAAAEHRDEFGSASPPLPYASNLHKQGVKKYGETSSVCYYRSDAIKMREKRAHSVDAISNSMIVGNKRPAATSLSYTGNKQKQDKRKDSNYEISEPIEQGFGNSKKKGLQWGDDASLSSCALVRKPAEWVYSNSTMDSITPVLDKRAVKGGKEITEFGNSQYSHDELSGQKHSHRQTEKKADSFENDLFNPKQTLRVIPYLPSLSGTEDVVLAINNRLFDCQEPSLVSKVQPKIVVLVNRVKKMATSVVVEMESREEINMRNKVADNMNIVLTFKKEISDNHRGFEELLQSLLMERNPFGDLDVLLIEQRKLTEIVAENENLMEGGDKDINKLREKAKLFENFGQQALLEIQKNPSKALEEMIAAVENYKKEEKVIESVKMAIRKKKKLDRAISNSRRMEQYIENVMAQLRYNIELMKACEEALKEELAQTNVKTRKSRKVLDLETSGKNSIVAKPKNTETRQKIPYTELPLRLNKPFEQTCKKIQRRYTGLSFMQLQYTFLMVKRHFLLLLRLYKTYTGMEEKNGRVFAGMSCAIWILCCQSLELPDNFNSRQQNYQTKIFYQCAHSRSREKDSILRYDDFIEAITQIAMHASPEKEVWDAIDHLIMYHVIPKALDGWDIELPNRNLLAIFEEVNNKAILQRVFSHYCSYQDKEVQGKLLSFSKWEKMVYQKDEKVLSFMNWQKLCQDVTQVGMNDRTRFRQPTLQDQQFAFFTSKSLFPKRGCANYTDALCWEEFLDAVVRLAFKVVVIAAQKENHPIREKTRILIRWLASIA